MGCRLFFGQLIGARRCTCGNFLENGRNDLVNIEILNFCYNRFPKFVIERDLNYMYAFASVYDKITFSVQLLPSLFAIESNVSDSDAAVARHL